MYVSIHRRFFQDDPADRFSRVFGCSPDVWREVWRRHKFLDYTQREANEYLMLVLKKNIRQETFKRWVHRTEAYMKAQIALKSGAKQVKSEYFGQLKDFVEKEMTKNL